MLRFTGSFLAACVVVFAMVLVAVGLWGGFEHHDSQAIEPQAHRLDLLVGYDSLDVAELFGEPRRQMPELQAPPPALDELPPSAELSSPAD